MSKLIFVDEHVDFQIVFYYLEQVIMVQFHWIYYFLIHLVDLIIHLLILKIDQLDMYQYQFVIQMQMVLLMVYQVDYGYEQADYRDYFVVHRVLLEFLV